VQEGGAHACGEGDERFLLPRFLDLDDGGGRQARAFGADHVQAGKAVLVAGAQIDHRRALDEAARLQVDAPLAMLQRQFDPVADQRLTGDQLILRRAMGGAEGGDQADARGVAPDQHGERAIMSLSARGAMRTRSSLAAASSIMRSKRSKVRSGSPKRMGQIEDRVVGLLPVDAVQLQPLAGLEPVEHHLARLAHRGQLRGIAEEDEGREDLGQVLELALVEHGAFVDEARYPAGCPGVSSR
jgi:hypothetical protein